MKQPPAMDKDKLNAFLAIAFPLFRDDYRILEVSREYITTKLFVTERHLRPGATISGPAMFALADVTMYCLVLANIGPKPLTVTTNCTINFLSKPKQNVDLVADGKLLKIGRRLATGTISIRAEGVMKPLAHATMTYAIPPTGSVADESIDVPAN
ncbi:MAG: PaaI family thioesterase [Aestuariivita sp.]|nr:PaaI family thioesterase [Aestuariivita sp.]MCY4203814.1 PaaI family thioesterase [Aestuariivita sp.]MCY4288429.1 PaaI family thioesterase [Aestuariivita sp.]MCY4345884.1 PaaI family thioesterase [Aestuariivita sp.]